MVTKNRILHCIRKSTKKNWKDLLFRTCNGIYSSLEKIRLILLLCEIFRFEWNSGKLLYHIKATNSQNALNLFTQTIYLPKSFLTRRRRAVKDYAISIDCVSKNLPPLCPHIIEIRSSNNSHRLRVNLTASFTSSLFRLFPVKTQKCFAGRYSPFLILFHLIFQTNLP